MQIQACVNGNRPAAEHPALPMTPAQAARTAAAVQQAGASSIHVHPRRADGKETLEAAEVTAWLTAIRQACPGLPVGISSGFWILPETAAQLAAARSWQVKPDFVSVNWHEPHATALAEELLAQGIGIEAGLWHMEGAEQFLRWPHRGKVTRLLLELPDEPDTGSLTRQLLTLAQPLARPVLLHGEGQSTWPLLKEARRLGLPSRIGLEDTLVRPDGTPAQDNAELVRLALGSGL